MSLHHRAVIKGYGFSPSLSCEMLKSTSDIGFAWGTEYKDNERVSNEIAAMQKRGYRVEVEVRDAG